MPDQATKRWRVRRNRSSIER